MSENHRSPRTIATGAAALLVAVVVLNVVPRLVSLPSLVERRSSCEIRPSATRHRRGRRDT